MGGGTSPTGDKKATNAEEAAYTPFFGEWEVGPNKGLASPHSRAMGSWLGWAAHDFPPPPARHPTPLHPPTSLRRYERALHAGGGSLRPV